MFTPITTGEITTGEPVSTATQTKIKENFDDHEERLQAAEESSGEYPAIVLRVGGYYSRLGATTGLIKTTTNFTLTLTGARIIVETAGSAGTLEIDIKRKRGGGAWESIFTALPSIGFGSGNDAISAAGTLDPSKVDLIAGDLLRLDTTSVQTNGKGFHVRLDFVR